MILFLLVSLIHSDTVSVNADDSEISTASEDENRLLYSNGGTWIQGSFCSAAMRYQCCKLSVLREGPI